MMPLSLSYDHRVIDGADAIRFLRWVCEALEQPFVMALRGLAGLQRGIATSASVPLPSPYVHSLH